MMSEKTISTRRMWWIALICGMASYIDAAAMSSSGTALVLLKGPLGLSPAEIGILTSSLTFSVAIGALFGGRIGDLLGRRRVFITTMIMIIVGSTLLASIENLPGLLTGMILVGLGTGADLPVSLATISEMSRAGMSATMVGFSHFLWKVGSIVSLGIVTIVGGMGQLGARILFGHIIVASILTLIGRLFVPESDRWSNERAEEKKNASSRSDAALGLNTLKKLLKPPFLTYFLSLAIFYTLVNLGSNTVGQYGAYMYTEVGNSTVQVYSTVKLISMFLGALLVLVFMKIVGTRLRMKFFTLGSICCVISMLTPLVFGPSAWTLNTMMFLWLVGTVFAGEGMMKVWTQESFPTLLRSSAQGAIIAIARFGSAALALITPLVLSTGPRALFGLLMTCSAIAGLLALIVFSHQHVNAIQEEEEQASPDSLAEVAQDTL